MRDDRITVGLDLEGFRVRETVETDEAVEAVIETRAGAGRCPSPPGPGGCCSGGRGPSPKAERARLGALSRAHPEIGRAWELRERLRSLYATADPAAPGRALVAWCQEAEASGLPSFVKLAGTIRRWKPEIPLPPD